MEELAPQPPTLYTRLSMWLEAKARGPYGDLVLFLTALTEASVFIVPPDVVMVAILLYVPQQWKRVAVISTIGSVAGGLIGYMIGYALFETVGVWVVETYGLADELDIVRVSFAEHAFVSIFIAAFTPIPYKVFTIAAGLFSVNVPIFLLASFLGRGLRFAAVGAITMKFGQPVLALVFRYFRLATLAALIMFILALLLI